MAMAIEILMAGFFFLVSLSLYCRLNKKSPLTNWPLVGMLPVLVRNAPCIHEYATYILQQSGGTFEFKGPWFGKMDFVITTDPANLHYILSRNFNNFDKGHAFKIIFDVLGDGLIVVESDEWKTQRQLIHSLMKHSNFLRFVAETTQQKVEKGLLPVLELVSKLGNEVDFQDLFQRFSFDATSILMFGFDTGCLSVQLPQILVAKAMDEMDEALLYRYIVPESCWKFQKWLQIGEERKITKGLKIFDHFVDQQISMKRSEYLKRSKTPNKEGILDLVTGLIELEEGKQQTGTFKISDKFLRDMVVNIFAAGRATGSLALAWFFWLVATNPSVQTNIREEIKANLLEKEDDGNEKLRFFSAQDVNRLVYLHGALCESLRLYPPVPFNHRATVKADVLPSGHRVGPDKMILLSLYSMGRMKEIWGDDCLEFKPGRWIAEGGGIKPAPSYKFSAFSAGPRSCIGKEIAFIQMKIVATAIIWNYHVQLVERHPVLPSISTVLHMKYGLKVRITKINKSRS